MPHKAYRASLDWIDTQATPMRERLLAWAQINSGSYHQEGLLRMHAQLNTAAQALGGEIDSPPLTPATQLRDDGSLQTLSLGNALRIRKYPQATRQVLLCGHMDTVFGPQHAFQHCRRIDDNTLNGPGVADMKGGLLVMLTAVAALEKSPYAGQVGWEIFINPDEEIGSLGSAPLLKAAAQQANIGLLYEPALADGTLAGARKGSGNFSLLVRGRGAHAGREHHLGRNAIAALARALQTIDTLNGQRDQVTINLGRISGGGAVNMVADLALCHFNIRIRQMEDEQWCLQQLGQIVERLNEQDGIHAELHGHFSRPPKPMTPQLQQLFALLQQCGAELSIEIKHQPTGGCCDGNNLSAAGLVNIDTMGVRGGQIHTADEFILLDSLTERAKLSALLLMKLANDEAAWPQPE